jgi:hypothetical protein
MDRSAQMLALVIVLGIVCVIAVALGIVDGRSAPVASPPAPTSGTDPLVWPPLPPESDPQR